MRLETKTGDRNGRRHLRAALTMALAVVVAAGVAGIAVVVWSRYYRRAGPADAGFDCPSVVKAHHASPLTDAHVERVTLIGDSIMNQASCALAERLADAGITTYRHAVNGTGLLTGTVDWVKHADDLLALERPNIVMAVFVGNYPTTINDSNGKPIARGSNEFFRAWQARAVELAAVVNKAHARMYWVSPPPIDVPILAYAQQLFEGYRKIPGTSTLDSGSILAGPQGQEVSAKKTCGRRTIVRSTIDAVHLTPDGARIYGEQIAHDLTASLAAIPTPKPC